MSLPNWRELPWMSIVILFTLIVIILLGVTFRSPITLTKENPCPPCPEPFHITFYEAMTEARISNITIEHRPGATGFWILGENMTIMTTDAMICIERRD